MALKGNIIEKTSGTDERRFVAEFTNGTIDQLKELSEFLEKEGFKFSGTTEADRLIEVVRIGISWLVTMKEKSQEKNPIV